MAKDDVVYPIIGNDDLIAAGLPPEDDDDTREDAVALLGIAVGRNSIVVLSGVYFSLM
jgi:hypothetical protein